MCGCVSFVHQGSSENTLPTSPELPQTQLDQGATGGGDYASLSQRSLGARPPEPVVVPPTPGTLKEMGAARGEKAKGSREAKLVNLGRLRAGTGAR